jgi:hypothetical protein
LGADLVYKAIGIYRTQDDLAKNVSYAGASLGGLIFADLNHDGQITSNDKYRFDLTPFPKLMFVLPWVRITQNFDLSILFQGQSGGNGKLVTALIQAPGNGLKYVANNSYTLQNTNSILR